MKRNELEPFIMLRDLPLLFKIKCPECGDSCYYEGWILSRIPLPEKDFGEKASHVRIICPKCGFIIDHREGIKLITEVIKNG